MPIQNGLPSIIKSVQQGSTTCATLNSNFTTTITAVNTAKSVISLNGSGNQGFCQLTNATTVTCQAPSNGITVYWTVTEYV